MEEILTATSEVQDSDNDNDNDDSIDSKKRVLKRRKKKSTTYIAEESEAIVDFLDASAAQKLRSSRPGEPKPADMTGKSKKKQQSSS